ncbi:uncharacterized protein LOC121374695 [Gigantopelta aegis]|uniref:uncharacterized protein LOC121374695 n=1 Tax=Gigantopelta aegis TaxID=1735272 RepID=UPI001B88AB88|nr:uncharacterized protein LOC121374695 [Gigantopelta aegis]
MKNDSSLATTIIKYHIVKGSSFFIADLMVDEKMLPSMEERSIRVNHFLNNGHTTVGGARLYIFDIKATNGVVHQTIDFMIPPIGSVVDVINNDPELTTLKKVVQSSSGLTKFLQGIEL